MLTRMYLYSTSTKLSIDVWLYLDRPGSLNSLNKSSWKFLIRTTIHTWKRSQNNIMHFPFTAGDT